MKCGACGTDNLEDALFCVECGSPLGLAGQAESSPVEGAAAAGPAGFDAGSTQVMMAGSTDPSAVPLPTAQSMPPAQMGTPQPVVQPAAAAQSTYAAQQGQKKGVSRGVVIGLVAVIAVLVVALVVVLAVVLPQGGANSASSESARPSSTVTLNSEAASSSSAASDASSSAAADVSAAEPSAAAAPAADPEATHGLQGNAGAAQSQYEREELYYNAPFWGAWIGAFSELGNAQNRVAEARAKGLDAQMFETTDWENLNPTHYWVVSIGRSQDEGTAQALVSQAQAAGYSDAYVKYTGNHR